MTVTNPLNWKGRAALFCMALTLRFGLMPRPTVAQEGKPVEGYPRVLQRDLDEVMQLEISWFDKSLKNANGSAATPPSAAPQENWPRFRGPNADGVAQDDSRLPEVWDTSTKVKWVADIPGWGWSSPVVWGNKVFLTTVVSEEENVRPRKGLYLGQGARDPAKGIHHWMVYCFDRDTGAVLWKREVHTGNPKVPRHPKNTYAAETATTDGERLYVLFGDLGLFCYDPNGKPVWSHPIMGRDLPL